MPMNVATNSPVAIRPSDSEILRRQSCISITDAMPSTSCIKTNQKYVWWVDTPVAANNKGRSGGRK